MTSVIKNGDYFLEVTDFLEVLSAGRNLWLMRYILIKNKAINYNLAISG
jgi:hypothetical protein